jgi:hypothetical protein
MRGEVGACIPSSKALPSSRIWQRKSVAVASGLGMPCSHLSASFARIYDVVLVERRLWIASRRIHLANRGGLETTAAIRGGRVARATRAVVVVVDREGERSAARKGPSLAALRLESECQLFAGLQYGVVQDCGTAGKLDQSIQSAEGSKARASRLRVLRPVYTCFSRDFAV